MNARWIFAALLLCTAPALPASEGRPVLAVMEFRDDSGAIAVRGGPARALRQRLALELRSRGFTVLGMEQLADVLTPEQLLARPPFEPALVAAVRKASGAEFLVSGTVAEFDEDVGTGFRKSLLSSGGRFERVAEGVDLMLDLTVLDARTGKTAYSRRVGGHSPTQKSEMPTNESEMERESRSGPGSRAVGSAAIEVADFLECELVRRDRCLVEYEAEEAPGPNQ